MRLILAAIISIISLSPAFAGWQYTEWGMSPDEVKAAAKKDTVWSVYDGGDFSVMSYDATISNKKFQVSFSFGKGSKLEIVGLGLYDFSKCDSIIIDLHSIYGAPLNKYQREKLYLWRDEKNNNSISLQIISNDVCSIAYKPIPLTNQEGGL